MNLSLLTSLLKNNLINKKTEFDAVVEIVVFGKEQTKKEIKHLAIKKIIKKEGEYYFLCHDTVVGSLEYLVHWEKIRRIDGMSPVRYAYCFLIDENGNQIVSHYEKRGPKTS